jgi:hypothetical protein
MAQNERAIAQIFLDGKQAEAALDDLKAKATSLKKAIPSSTNHFNHKNPSSDIFCENRTTLNPILCKKWKIAPKLPLRCAKRSKTVQNITCLPKNRSKSVQNITCPFLLHNK